MIVSYTAITKKGGDVEGTIKLADGLTEMEIISAIHDSDWQMDKQTIEITSRR